MSLNNVALYSVDEMYPDELNEPPIHILKYLIAEMGEEEGRREYHIISRKTIERNKTKNRYKKRKQNGKTKIKKRNEVAFIDGSYQY